MVSGAIIVIVIVIMCTDNDWSFGLCHRLLFRGVSNLIIFALSL